MKNPKSFLFFLGSCGFYWSWERVENTYFSDSSLIVPPKTLQINGLQGRKAWPSSASPPSSEGWKTRIGRAGGKTLWLLLPLRESVLYPSGNQLAVGVEPRAEIWPQNTLPSRSLLKRLRTRRLGTTCRHGSHRGISRLFRLYPTLWSNWGPPKHLHHVCLGPCLIWTLHVWQKYGFFFNLHRRASRASWRQTVCRQRQSKQSRDKEVTCVREDMQRAFVKDTGPVPLS